MAWWQDEQFRICKKTFTFPLETILSLVEFVENYTLQPQNEVQSQYYHSEHVSIMVHITYQHGLDSNEENRVILKEIHFFISDDRTHDIHYVQHCFKLFYDHVIAMDIPFHLVRWLCWIVQECTYIWMVVFVAHKIQGSTYMKLFWNWSWKRRAWWCWCMHKNYP